MPHAGGPWAVCGPVGTLCRLVLKEGHVTPEAVQRARALWLPKEPKGRARIGPVVKGGLLEELPPPPEPGRLAWALGKVVERLRCPQGPAADLQGVGLVGDMEPEPPQGTRRALLAALQEQASSPDPEERAFAARALQGLTIKSGSHQREQGGLSWPCDPIGAIYLSGMLAAVHGLLGACAACRALIWHGRRGRRRVYCPACSQPRERARRLREVARELKRLQDRLYARKRRGTLDPQRCQQLLQQARADWSQVQLGRMTVEEWRERWGSSLHDPYATL